LALEQLGSVRIGPAVKIIYIAGPKPAVKIDLGLAVKIIMY